MRRILILVFLIPAFFGKAYAEEPEAARIFDAARMQSGLSDSELAVSGEPGAGQYDAASSLMRLFRYFSGRLLEELRANLDFAAELFGLVLVCALACALCPGEKTRQLTEICGVCVLAALLLGKMDSLISQTVEAMYRLSDYSKAALPVVYTAAAASGGAGTAALGYAGACLGLDILMSLQQKLMIPLVYVSLCLSLTNVVFPHPLLTALEKLSKWVIKNSLTALTLSFTAYLGMTTLISRNADAAALKATRTVISTSLPVVGGMLSDASSAVLSAASVVLGCTGVFGLVAVCVICAGPFAVLSVKCFLLKAVSAVAEAMQSPRLEKMLSGVNAVMGTLMGILGSCAIMLFLAFASALKVMTV